MNPPLRLLSAFPSNEPPQWIVAIPEHDAWAAASLFNRRGWMLVLPDWGGCVRLTQASIRRGCTYRGRPLPARVRTLAYILVDYVEQKSLQNSLCLALCADTAAGPRQDYAYQQALHTLTEAILKAEG
jgi:hypothetical protein